VRYRPSVFAPYNPH